MLRACAFSLRGEDEPTRRGKLGRRPRAPCRERRGDRPDVQAELELDGYQVEVAGDGEAALEMARSSAPDIIFLDLRLPKLDGLQVLETFRSDPTTQMVPVVILSSCSEKELVQRGAKLGVLDHLIKSKTTPARLAGALPRWLGP